MENYEYFRFSRKSIIWNSEAINAELQNYTSEHMKIQREWWYGKPLSIPVPKLCFAIPEDGPMPDNYWNATLFDLYSLRLVTILEKAGVFHEIYPVEMVGKKSGAIIPVEYKVFRLLDIQDVLDREKSVIRYDDHIGQSVKYLVKPVLKEVILNNKILLTRIRGFENISIIHVDLMSLLEKEGVSGCKYTDLDAPELFS